jgi:hypothetical protein
VLETWLGVVDERVIEYASSEKLYFINPERVEKFYAKVYSVQAISFIAEQTISSTIVYSLVSLQFASVL